MGETVSLSARKKRVVRIVVPGLLAVANMKCSLL